MKRSQSSTTDRPGSQPAASPTLARPGTGQIPPVLARADASEPAELHPVAVRGYN